MASRGNNVSHLEHACDVYALVEATPISQPALMWTPQCVERAMAEPTVLVMPMHSAPRAFAYSSACMRLALQERICGKVKESLHRPVQGPQDISKRQGADDHQSRPSGSVQEA